jgi:hypothetical protein
MSVKCEISVPDYSPEQGIRLEWEPNFAIDAQVIRGEVVLRANSAGLRSLARHLLELAQPNVPPGCHIHLDPSTGLEDGSSPLIIERIAD